MAIRSKVAGLVDQIAERVDWLMAPRLRTRRESELVAQWVASSEDVRELRYPAAYMQFMRQWHERSSWDVRWIKRAELPVALDNAPRLATLLEELGKQAPIPPVSFARTAAKTADTLLDDRHAIRSDRWAADVGSHFGFSSSLAKKGRLLCSAMRFLRPGRVLELGTAYGMSSLFMGLELERLSETWSITTVELFEYAHTLASATLGEVFQGRANCLLGSSQAELASLNSAGARFDFLFHDAHHSFEAYVSDFSAAEPMLASGAVCLIDDIRWEDARFSSGAARTYEGWQQIAAHPRVVMAAELDQSIGIVLLS
jgi:predicted O-methyltransferase YrrM